MKELEKVEKWWPEREIFQGAARAYLRYCGKDSSHWRHVEEPLWISVLGSMDLEKMRILDIGAGGGKMVGLCFDFGVPEKRMVALEPNGILLNDLKKEFPKVWALPERLEKLEELKIGTFNLVMANMVVSELNTNQFGQFVRGAKSKLKEGGILIYSSPNPRRKAEKHGIAYESQRVRVEESAPWGGLVWYYHRSIEYQVEELKKVGFEKVTICLDGYDDTEHMHEGPKRMLVVAGNLEVELNELEEVEVIKM